MLRIWADLGQGERQILVVLDTGRIRQLGDPAPIDLGIAATWTRVAPGFSLPSADELRRGVDRLTALGLIGDAKIASDRSLQCSISGLGCQVVEAACWDLSARARPGVSRKRGAGRAAASVEVPRSRAARGGKLVEGERAMLSCGYSSTDRARRDAMAWMLRERGMSLRQIGEAMDLSAARAGEIVERYRKEIARRIASSRVDDPDLVARLRQAGALFSSGKEPTNERSGSAAEMTRLRGLIGVLSGPLPAVGDRIGRVKDDRSKKGTGR